MTVEETIAALDSGELRVADKRDGEWVVNEDAKRAILEYFKLRKVEPLELGPFEYTDKIPLKRGHEQRGVRVVPGAVVRYGSFLGEGVVVMPGFVNIGAWVGPRTMVDTWASACSYFWFFGQVLFHQLPQLTWHTVNTFRFCAILRHGDVTFGRWIVGNPVLSGFVSFFNYFSDRA